MRILSRLRESASKHALRRSNRPRSRAGQAGFTLLEVILLVAIIAIAIPPSMALLSHVVVGAVDSEKLSQGAALAQERLEQIIAGKYRDGYTWAVSEGNGAEEYLANGFTRSVSVDTAGVSYESVSYARVTVTVSHATIPDVELTAWLTNHED